MPTPTKGPRLGGSPAHERLMLANLATSLFEHGRITTTETKAKRLRPLAELPRLPALEVGEPTKVVLLATPAQFRAVRVHIVEPADRT